MTQQITISARAWAELSLLSLIWGGVFLAVSLALRDVGVFTLVAFRVGGGALVLWAYILLRRFPIPKSAKTWGAFLVMGLLNNVLPFSLIAWGQLRIDIGLSSILNGSTAIFGILVAAIVFADERLTGKKLIGVMLGFLGVGIALGISALKGFDLASLAQLAILAASLSYAFAGVWARTHFKDLHPEVAATGMVSSSSIFMIAIALKYDGIPTMDYSLTTWFALAYMSVLATALAYLLYYRVLALAGAGNLLLVTLLIPPFAVLLGALVLGETLEPRAFAGFTLLAAGMLILDGRVLRIFKRN